MKCVTSGGAGDAGWRWRLRETVASERRRPTGGLRGLPPTPGWHVWGRRRRAAARRRRSTKRGTSASERSKICCLRHQIPSGALAEIIDRAVTLLLERVKKQKIAATDRPTNSFRDELPDSRYIPATIKRAVWDRDNGQCTLPEPAAAAPNEASWNSTTGSPTRTKDQPRSRI